ncbi:hypothetical protein [Bizionia sp. M204]|uniref:hypothetical protein n=1 Tax=Bizionia sp. M204 TaxID=2675331 RepID=UPI00204C56F3|nr:hypothetical protein [Bizionia sp. M204]UPS92485.1 hypothetical protein GMA17_12455 [Bizionia sp. M204]
MRKVLSITILTLFFAGSINAVNLSALKIEQKQKTCEENAWYLADFIYEYSGGDGFYTGAVLQSALELCE